MIRYSSTTLETIRFDFQPAMRDRRELLNAGWEQHIYQPRLFMLKRELRPLRFRTVAGFVLPPEADQYDKGVLGALFEEA